MANNKDDHDDSSVVTDKSSRIVADGEHLTPAPPIFSASSAKAHSIERSQINPHPSSQRRSDGGFNDTLNPLRALPELRPIPWHSGKELSPDKSTQSTRVQTRGACLLASRGNVNDPPCNHCKSGVGRFYVCVSLKNWFHGACATCQLATRGNLCSLRTDRDPSVISESEQQESPSADATRVSTILEPSSSAPAIRLPRKSNADQMQSESRYPALAAATRATMVGLAGSASSPDDEYRSQFGLKRKRESLQGTSVYRPYVSPYAPLESSNRLASSLANTATTASTPNMIIPANIARDHAAYNNYIRERDIQQIGTAPRPPRLSSSPPDDDAVNGNGQRASPTFIGDSQNNYQGSELDRDRTESMSPSAQLLDRPLKSPSPDPSLNSTNTRMELVSRMATKGSRKKAATNGTVTQPNSSRVLDPPDTPLIDTLPRRKQNHIYGIIGGLQSGIRSCQQRAESMQKQLDLLQAALGIAMEVEEEKEISVVE